MTRGVPAPPEERFWDLIEPAAVEACWLWAGTTTGGYGRFCAGSRRTVIAHRWAYEHLIGPVPEGLQLDHLCQTRRCVNPWHLDPVPALVNVRRAPKHHANTVECPRGHDYATHGFINAVGRRVCRPCNIDYHRRYHREHRDLANAQRQLRRKRAAA